MKAWFADLYQLGPYRGHHTNPEKIFFVTSTDNLDIETSLFQGEGFKITTGIIYRGGFLGSEEEATNYIW